MEVDPRLADGGHPDFLVAGLDGKAYVEATYLSQRSTDPPLEAKVLNAIDDLDCHVPMDVGLSVWVTGSLKRAPRLRPITDDVCSWLNHLDLRSARWHDGAEKHIRVDPECGDLILTLQAVPRTIPSRVIQVWASSDSSAIVGEAIYKAVSKKANRYKDLRHPLVVAVNISSAGAEVHEEAALFGHQALRLRHNAICNEWTSEGIVRTGKALWFDYRQCHSRYPKLSALMMFHNLAPWTVANVSACLYLNPYVDDRVPRELRTLGYAAEADGELRRYKGSRLVRDVLGLPEDWPGSFVLGD